MLCRIDHFEKNSQPARRRSTISLLRCAGSEQFRTAIVGCLRDHWVRDEHFFSLFQVL
jgi:hypothetical protein